MVEDIETLTFQGQPTLAIVSTQNLTVGGVSITGSAPPPKGIFYVQQDPATNNVLVIGDNMGPNGSDRVALQPEVFYPGQWSASTAYDNTLAWASGGSTEVYLNVSGTQTVSTPIGNFEAWVAPNGAIDSVSGATDTGIDYWSPQLGAPVQYELTANLPNGAVNHLVGTLAKTNRVNSLYPVLANKLNHPRGLAFDPAGSLWLTEAGVGGSGPCIPFMGNTNCFGNSGRISRIVDGKPQTVVDSLASLATPLVDQATGANGIAFAGGKPYVIIGNGGPQSAVDVLGSLADQTGVLLGLTASGSGTYSTATAGLISQYEYVNDPDHRPNPDGTLTPESNPYAVTAIGRNVFVADAGAHTALRVQPNGSISLIGVIPAQSVNQPAFPGAPVPTQVDSVPTAIIPAPDGKGLLVADFTGYPYFPGTASIWRVRGGRQPTVYASGFTNLIGLSPAEDGGVYALEMAANGFLSGDPSGAIIHVSPAGQQQVVACHGLVYPTGITTGQNGALFVSNYGVIPGYGEVVEVPSAAAGAYANQ